MQKGTVEYMQAFQEHYYKTFDQSRAALQPLYQDNAILSFEGQKFQGQAAVIGKLTSLPFQQVIPQKALICLGSQRRVHRVMIVLT